MTNCDINEIGKNVSNVIAMNVVIKIWKSRKQTILPFESYNK